MKRNAPQPRSAADRSEWAGLTPAELAARLEAMIRVHGSHGERGLPDALPVLYAFVLERVDAPSRREVYRRLAVAAAAGDIAHDALFPFLREDDDPQIVSQAASHLALHLPAAHDDDIDGPGQVLRAVFKGGVLNPGAAIAGLLLLGDPGVCARLAPLREVLAGRELEHTLLQLVTCASGELHAATIEFYLEWLEELVRECPTPQAFTHVASGLAIQRRSATTTTVIGGKRVFPAKPDAPAYLPGWRAASLAEYARSIAPRLAALEAQEAEPKVMTRVRETWLGCCQETGSLVCEPDLH